jgi:hypothetical protein
MSCGVLGKKAGPGRPVVHGEPWRKVSILLLNRQIVFLDTVAVKILERTGAAVNRAELVRAMIDAVASSNIDLTGATNEESIRNLLLEKLSPE